MQIVLLGTGSADGWPNPFCRCRSCEIARTLDQVRGHTASLVDGRILIDCGPDVPRAAERFGYSLADVDLVLLTHAHPDHVHGLAFLAHQWSQTRRQLLVVGPKRAVAEIEQWLEPGGSVSTVEVRPGDEFEHDGYRITAFAATHDQAHIGSAMLYGLVGPDGSSLLHATDTGPLSATTHQLLQGRAFDVALLEETFGWFDHNTDHLDLRTFPLEVARLRRSGALTITSRVLAVHLSHHNPPPNELASLLSNWDAELSFDGQAITLGTAPQVVASAASPQRTLITGGARSGKSRWAEHLLASSPEVIFVATAQASDAEMAERISRHQATRPAAWQTRETLDLASVLRDAQPNEALLIDCLTLWLSRIMDEAAAWSSADTTLVDKRIDELVLAWRGTRAQVVAVTNEVGSGIVPVHASARLFRDVLGQLNSAIANESDRVLLSVAGQLQTLKGEA